MGATRGELLGFCKSQNDALLSLSLYIYLSPFLIHTHPHYAAKGSHTPINVPHTKEAPPMHSLPYN